jgi:murein DD-endopeptidase MepM/ murein hydrolase activator NlpD
MNVDPLAELMKSDSPYNYAFNNPVYFIDDEGLIPIPQIVKAIRTSSGFGMRYHRIRKKMIGHGGIDLVAPTGSEVRSAAIGTIAKIGYDPDGYGNYIIVKHVDGYFTLYGHLSKVNNGIKVGTKIDNGQVIGKSGNTGISTGPHLHFEIIKANSLAGVFNKANKINPLTFYDLNECLYHGMSNSADAGNNNENSEGNNSSDTNSNNRTPVEPLPPITPMPVTPTPIPLPDVSPLPNPSPSPSPVVPPLPVIPPKPILD